MPHVNAEALHGTNQTARTGAGGWRMERLVHLAVLLGVLVIIWNSLGDHALYAPDEGRYAAVSADMVEHGHWLQPRFRDVPHLTKPPLTYWAQALSIMTLGATEFAVRLPGALGATLMVLGMFWFVRRTCGARMATLTVGVYGVMPLTVVMERLATTDVLLNTWWFMALCFGYLAVTEERPRWVVAFWAMVALAGLTKGPLILAPVMLLGAWLVLAGRPGWILRLRPFTGLPLALLPLAVTAYLYWQADPARAVEVWRSEFVDRFHTQGVHRDPFWVLLPVFLIGCFPATPMMVYPGINVRGRLLLETFRAGDLRALMLLAVVLPLIGFSMLSGKQHSYVLPLAAPMAFLAALTLWRRLEPWGLTEPAPCRALKPLQPPRPVPEVRGLCAFSLCMAAWILPAMAYLGYRVGFIPPGIPEPTVMGWTAVFIAPVAGWLICVVLWDIPGRRVAALLCAFAGMVGMWLGLQRVENTAHAHMETRALAARLEQTGRPVLAWTLNDPTIDFYMGRWTDFVNDPAAMRAWTQEHPDGVVLIAERSLRRMRARQPGADAGLREVRRFTLWPLRAVIVLEPDSAGAGDSRAALRTGA